MSIALLGGGGHASDVLAVIEALKASDLENRFPVLVADDDWSEPERFERRDDVKMVESIREGAELAPFVVSVGYPGGRRAVYEIALAAGGSAATPLVHPHASVGVLVTMGDGVVVMGQSWLSPRVEIGQHTHVGYGVTIGHDTVVGEFSSVMPGACIGGDINIGSGVLVGANSTVLQGLTVGDGAIIGAGAVVTKNVAVGVTVVGNPARAMAPSAPFSPNPASGPIRP